MRSRFFGTALRVTSVYFLLAGLWILFSDRLLAAWATDAEQLTRLQTYKGWAFVAATGCGFYALLAWRGRAEERLRYQAALLESVNDAIIASDAQYRITAWNAAAESLYGWKAEEVLGRNGLEITRTEWSAAEADEMGHHLAEAGHWRGELTQMRKDGTRFPVDISFLALRDRAEQTTGYLSVILDITERRQAEQALRESEARYKGLFEDSPIALWEEDFSAVKQRLDVLRQEGVTDFAEYFAEHPHVVSECAALVRVLDVNKETLALQKTNRKEDLLKGIADALEGEPLQSFSDELVRIAAGETSFHWQGLNRTLDRRMIDISVNWSAVPGYEDSLSRVIVSMIDITERKQAQARIERQVHRLSALRAVDAAISSSFDLRLSLSILIAQAINELQVDAAAVLILNKFSNELEYAAGAGFRGGGVAGLRQKAGEGYAGQAALERRTVIVPNLAETARTFPSPSLLVDERFAAFVAVPLVAKGEIKGVMELFHRSRLDPDSEWLDFLETLAGQAAIAVDSAQTFSELQRSNIELSLAYDATIEGWSRAMDLRDKETEGHTHRVTELAVQLGRAMHLPEQEVTHIRRGALLHDIGKMGVPDAILLKPGPLTEAEWAIMKQHPTFAHEMLSQVRYLEPAINIPYCHHEKWDGTGYPRGLRGDQIPLSARIFAVIDVYDALTSQRPYRAAWSLEKAQEHIRSETGKSFDPEVVDIFLRVIVGND